jgi:hypothetical protein
MDNKCNANENESEWPTLCAAGSNVTVGMLAQIATILEQHGRIKVYGVAIPEFGPGIAALMLGNALKAPLFGYRTRNRRFVSHGPGYHN